MKPSCFDVKHFAVHDGPGIRTTLFLKGCNLRCKWCHNPESIRGEPEVFYYQERCAACGRCVEACPGGAHGLTNGEHIFDRSKCKACFACVRACPTEALERCGAECELDAIARELLEDEPFYYRSGGGVTISGGEPLLQADFVVSLTDTLHARGVHVAIDTAGSVSGAESARALGAVDLVLYDLKAGIEELHRELTAGSLDPILRNLRALDESDVSYWVRVPLIPGLNDGADNLAALAGIIAGLRRVEKVEVLPFHQFGSHKYDRLGRDYQLAHVSTPDGKQIREFSERLVPKAMC